MVFGRSNQDQKLPPQAQPATAAPAPPAAQPAAAQPAPAAAAPSGGNSLIGEDLFIVGEKITVVTQSRVKVDGTIQGDVNGKEVIVGPKGKVIGTVTADVIQVEGQIHGALKGASVTLMPSARVDGDIFHQKLAISEGAEFDGRVRRPQDAAELTPNLNVDSLKGGES